MKRGTTFDAVMHDENNNSESKQGSAKSVQKVKATDRSVPTDRLTTILKNEYKRIETKTRVGEMIGIEDDMITWT